MACVVYRPCMWNLINRDWQPVGTIPPTWLENIRGELTTPGQWYHDKQHQKILYYPLPGQDMAKVRAMLPVEEVLVRHEGARSHVWKNIRCGAYRRLVGSLHVDTGSRSLVLSIIMSA